MATERRAPEDLQEAVAATLRRLRGEIGAPGQAPIVRQQPTLGPTLTGPGAPFVATPPAASPPPDQPDLLSRAEAGHEIPPNPSARLDELREALARPDPGERPRPRLLPYMLSILAVAVFAGIGWWAYKSVNGTPQNGEVPVVAASQTPEKVPPTADQPADTSTSSGNKTIYNAVAPGSAPEPKTEVLLAPPEAPQLPPATDTTAAPVTTTADAGATTGTATTTTAAGSTGTGTANNQGSAAAANGTTTMAATSAPSTTGSTTSSSATTTQAPAASQTTAASGSSGLTETLIPGASTSSGSTAATAPQSTGSTTASAPATTSSSTDTTGQSSTTTVVPAAPLTVESAPPATPPATTASTDNGNGSAASTAAVAPATPATTAATVPASPTATQTASLGNYRIQLASLKSEAAANQTWQRLATKYKDILANLTVHIEKVALSSGVYYRLQAGPFQDKASAYAACGKLKAQGQQCLVRH